MVDSARGKLDFQYARLREGLVGKVQQKLERQHPEWLRLRYYLHAGRSSTGAPAGLARSGRAPGRRGRGRAVRAGCAIMRGAWRRACTNTWRSNCEPRRRAVLRRPSRRRRAHVRRAGGAARVARPRGGARGSDARRGRQPRHARASAPPRRRMPRTSWAWRSARTLGLPDLGLDRHDAAQLTAVVACIRRHRPELVVAPDADDEHPDHVEAHASGGARVLRRGHPGALRRRASGTAPRACCSRSTAAVARPHLVVDVSAVWDRRRAALRTHRSQLDPAAGPAHLPHRAGFPGRGRGARARVGRARSAPRHGEAYRMRGPVPIADARALLAAGAQARHDRGPRREDARRHASLESRGEGPRARAGRRAHARSAQEAHRHHLLLALRRQRRGGDRAGPGARAARLRGALHRAPAAVPAAHVRVERVLPRGDTPPRTRCSTRRPRNLALTTKMVEVVENYRLDVLHVHYAMPFAASAYLARQLLLPRQLGVVTTLHGTDITVVGTGAGVLPRHAVQHPVQRPASRR